MEKHLRFWTKIVNRPKFTGFFTLKRVDSEECFCECACFCENASIEILFLLKFLWFYHTFGTA